jgi:hypothetical protein
MLTTMLMTALIQAAPAAPAPPAEPKKVVRETIIREYADGTVSTERKGEGGTREVERNVLIIRDGKDAPGERREVRVLRKGAPGAHMAVLADCQGGRKFETEADAGDKGKQSKTRILLCSKGGETDVAWVQRLRDTAKRIESDENLSPETRTKVVAALNQAIAHSTARE